MASHDMTVAPDLSGIPPLNEWVEERCAAELVDNGRPFDPSAAPYPNLTGSLEDRDAGGLGIHLIRNMVDRVEYRREDGQNRLRIETARAEPPTRDRPAPGR